MRSAAAARLLVLALLVGAAVMVLEIAAPRLLAPHLGTTALVWTVVIATFLGALAAGNVLGGHVADGARPAALPLVLACGALATAAAIPLEALARTWFAGWPHGLRTLATVPFAFALPALLLGAASPLLARALLRADERPGRALGLLSAAGAIGSVAGTFLAGYVLVPHHGTRTILLVTAAALLASALVAIPTRPTPLRAERGRGAAPAPLGWGLLAALAGAALLGLEVLAGRMASAYVGASIYTWTSVIGVTLGALAVGALAGGALADRVAPRPLLAALLAAAGFATATTLWAPAVLAGVLDQPLGLTIPFAGRVLLGVAAPFALPCALVGALSPVVLRAALASPERDGRVVGGLYAAGTVGAVLAAAGVPTLLIPVLSLEGVAVALALLLVGASALVHRARWALLAVPLAAVGALALGDGEDLRRAAAALHLPRVPADTRVVDSRYFRIRAYPAENRWVHLQADPDFYRVRDDPLLEGRLDWIPGRRALLWRGPMSVIQKARVGLAVRAGADRAAIEVLRRLTREDVQVLRLDRLIHSFVNLDDPTWLGYEYEQTYDAVVARVAPPGRPLRALFLGGGGYAYQRHLLATRGDEIRIVTAEIDPEVTAVARERLGLADDPRHTIVHDDARTVVDGLGPDAPPFDLVFGDAFNDLVVPFHLTSREFAAALARRMGPEGVYMANVIDVFRSGRFLAAFVATLRTSFADVRVLATAPRLDSDQETFVVVAGKRPLDLEGLAEGRGASPGILEYPPEEIALLIARNGGLVLEDDHAPVEALLAPVVEARDTR